LRISRPKNSVFGLFKKSRKTDAVWSLIRRGTAQLYHARVQGAAAAAHMGERTVSFAGRLSLSMQWRAGAARTGVPLCAETAHLNDDRIRLRVWP
jgi:hypothetical protein